MDPAPSKEVLWPSPPERLVLTPEEVHLWRADLEQETVEVAALFDTLSPDECLRANRYYFRRDSDDFVVARGVLRNVISRYLNISAREIRFSHNRYGKLRLRSCDTPLCFNVSHANGMALYAVGHARAVGVDIEYVRQDRLNDEIARRFFSVDEVAALRTLPSDLRTTAFFNCWTRKEAYIKALGEGLSHPLDSFTVSIVPGQPVRLLRADDPRETSRWTLMEVSIGVGYVASLAVEGAISTLRQWQWNEKS